MANPKRVMVVISDMECGGAQQVVSKLLKAMLAKDFCLGLATLSSPTTDFFEVDQRVERYPMHLVDQSATISQRIKNNFLRVYGIRKAISAFKPDAVVSFIAPTNCLTILASAGLDVRVVVSERNDPRMQSFGWIWDRLRRVLYRFADIVTANSRDAVESLSEYVGRNKLQYLRNPARYTTEEETVTVEYKGHPYFLSVARLHWQKNHEVTIKAFARIAQFLPDWRLVFVGTGERMEYLKNLVSQSNLEGRVLFEGQVSDPAEYYRRAELFIMVSMFEGQPNALLEAMIFELPVIVSDTIPDVDALVVKPRSGLKCAVNDETALADAMLRLAKDSDQRRTLGANGRRFMETYDGQEILEQWMLCILP